MKTIHITLLWIYCLAYMAHGGSVVIAWDKTPGATGYRVWQGIRLVKSVVGTQATVTLPDSGIQTLGVTALYGTLESAMTEIQLIPIAVQSTNDLKIWKTDHVFYREVAARMFFRLTPPSVINDSP